MNILAINTVAHALNVAAEGAQGTAVVSIEGAHCCIQQQLVRALDVVVKRAGFPVQETQIVACPRGPGSFTGLRTGFAVARALQLGVGARFIAVPTLRLAAHPFRAFTGRVLSILDAKRGRFFWNCFKSGEPLFEDSHNHAQEIVKKVDTRVPCLVCGTGTALFKSVMESQDNTVPFMYVETDAHEGAKTLLALVKVLNHSAATPGERGAPQYTTRTYAKGS
ncbi:conserved hypothetical protein [Treponema paraluiscuniculi Cuniculi A]|uniref:Gcp-like domain-containing protein n=2 Tax=Treponema paraluiscuniculi TaxID=53435 RepID=F7XQX1_TREPU|nr:tRNA (adenosine(37)-N6)-threonylcarbamoyltransferase complex dimerization subunit type 1 TsaB [Treponema paraluiscuniculi]AEH40802.1 conserved hypothetical protein [Treponema paraluiscuniculi Cuniculi A]WKC72731.1 hypothetical protein TPLL2_0876 [Treponema paraluiscuniculi]